MGILGFLLMLVAPPVLAVLLAFLQLGVYHGLARLGVLRRAAIPMFLILWLRGMIAVVACAAVMGIWQNIAGNGSGNAH
ncbi:MAG: hypothetical protein H0X38_04670 [Planctomycetes bacterium]|nr:hypothetical protein [Planctomycetota bacterium]